MGFSGGLDSTVLLHALAAMPLVRERGLRAIHVHHGLNGDADAWAMHCERTCSDWGIALDVTRVQVDREGGHGPEGAARAARLAAFRAALGEDESLALAHHQDDQAETLLLRLMRGAGGDGLAAMRRRSRIGSLRLWRPLLELPRTALREYANAHALEWIEDPSNGDAGYDRNFLRLRVLPLLAERWPQAKRQLARSAALLAEQSLWLNAISDGQLDALQMAPDVLSIPALLTHPRTQRARILRAWLLRLHGRTPPANILAAIERDLLPARTDGDGLVAWADIALHRWRDRLHARIPTDPLPPDWNATWDGSAPLPLPDGGRLLLSGTACFDSTLAVQARRGGERIHLSGRSHHHALKHVLQDRDVPPWVRASMPLLFDADGELLAAGDAILSARMEAWLGARGASLLWQPPGAPAGAAD